MQENSSRKCFCPTQEILDLLLRIWWTSALKFNYQNLRLPNVYRLEILKSSWLREFTVLQEYVHLLLSLHRNVRSLLIKVRKHGLKLRVPIFKKSTLPYWSFTRCRKKAHLQPNMKNSRCRRHLNCVRTLSLSWKMIRFYLQTSLTISDSWPKKSRRLTTSFWTRTVFFWFVDIR